MTNRHFSTFDERVAWLLKHHEFLTEKTDERPIKRRIVLAMKRDGLVSKKTYWPDVGLDDAIHQAKIRWFASHNR